MNGATLAVHDFDKLWNYSDPAATEKLFRAKLDERKDADADYRAQLLTQIARAQGLQRQFAPAHATLDGAEEIITSTQPVPRVALVRLLLERGRVFNSSGSPEQAKPFFDDALKFARQAKADFHAIDAAHMLGIVTKGDESVQWNERAMAMAEASSDERAKNWLGSLYNNLGWTYHDSGNFEKALDLFQRGLRFRMERKQESETLIARWAVARALRSLGRVDEALLMQQELEKAHAAKGKADGYVFEEIGECLLLLKREAEAKAYFAKAYAELSKDEWLKANEAKRLQRLAELGGVQLL
ncbi:MAG: tetratricopeptide repeat protein [Phycisphaeraceae bacterium]